MMKYRHKSEAPNLPPRQQSRKLTTASHLLVERKSEKEICSFCSGLRITVINVLVLKFYLLRKELMY